jgi:hypothetical protein
MRIAPAIAVAFAWLAGGVAESSPPPMVSCDKIILSVASGTQGGYRVVLGAVSVPPPYLWQVVRSNESARFPYWRKAGLVVRGGSPAVTVTVPKPWRTRAAITWGNSTGSELRMASCPALAGQPWNAYAGGFLLRSHSACVPLVFRVGRQTATVRFGIGQRCK